MLKKYILYGLVFVFLYSCKKGNDYVIYNNALTSSKNLADSTFINYSKQVSTYIRDSLYNYIDKSTDSVLLIIQGQVDLIEAKKVPANGLKFKQSSVAYLNTLSTIAKSYKGYLILNDEMATISQIDSAKLNIKLSEKALDSILNHLISDQNEFARLSNIKLIQ